MRALSPPLSRIVALAILVGLGAVLYFGVAGPLRDDYRTRSALAAATEAELVRYERIAGVQPQRRAELAALKQHEATQDGFLDGPNETLVAAQLQNRIKSLVAAGQGELVSAEILPAQEDGNFRRIGVRGQLAISMAGALRVFHDLELTSPLLFLDNVELHGQAEARRPAAAGQPSRSVIDVHFDVYGYMHGPAHDPTAPAVTPAGGRGRP